MAIFQRKAGVIWNGTLQTGNGTISTESQALYEEPYSYATRFGDDTGANPEELIAAAHAACFSMALANTLKQKGYEPLKVDTNATCILQSKNGGFEISQMKIHVRGQVSNIDLPTFKQIVQEADRGCPVSNLLRDGLDIEIDAELM
jgi:osmotically inducible protein OsmC